MKNRKRNNITFSCSPLQHQKLTNLAKERNISISDLMRESLFGEIPQKNFKIRLSKKQYLEKYGDAIELLKEGKTTKEVSIYLDASVSTITKVKNYAIEENILDPIYKSNNPQIIRMYLKQKENIDYLRNELNELKTHIA